MKRTFLTALAVSAALTSSAFAEITGKVTFDGKAPDRKPAAGIAQNADCAKSHKTPLMDETVVVGKGGELANAVVYLKKDGLKGEVPADEVLLDQVGCVYVPHVVSVTVGQKLVAQNSDPFLHNVHSLPEVNPGINKGQAIKGQKDPIPTKAAEQFIVKCDIHPWMKAWVAVFDHPFHSVTGEDGVFSIDTKGLQDGDYDVVVWHEKYKECAAGKVAVKGGKGTVDLKAAAPKAAGPAVEEKAVTVSTAGAKAACCADGKCAEATTAAATDKAVAAKPAAAVTTAAGK
jgi:plastocyanin